MPNMSTIVAHAVLIASQVSSILGIEGRVSKAELPEAWTGGPRPKSTRSLVVR